MRPHRVTNGQAGAGAESLFFHVPPPGGPFALSGRFSRSDGWAASRSDLLSKIGGGADSRSAPLLFLDDQLSVKLADIGVKNDPYSVSGQWVLATLAFFNFMKDEFLISDPYV